MNDIYTQIARKIKAEYPELLIKDIVEALSFSDIEEEIDKTVERLDND